ncbi:MAG: NUDIX hydrolase [uncultured bacterium]|nr:MAG: NUDIX hydrolase [uncultured bacterium]OGH89146.1 MAG: hypothetical protein A2507_00660 [Candidatus Magasanikbacteria bacterium RIFOXYD12_FULL_33_17]HAO52875.1 hypothetical protein [Candidatus Magasanikbacteria bacterium]
MKNTMKIPKNAKKVFTGVLFDVYQWPQKMFDGTFKTFEKLSRKHSIQVLAITTDKKIIVLKEQHPDIKPFYGVIGGGQEGKETPLQTAKRELQEETGYTAKKWELIDVETPSSKLDWTIYTYLAKDAEKTHEQKLDSGEKVEVMKVSFTEFMKYATNHNFMSTGLSFYLLKLNYHKKLGEFKKKLFDK